MANLVPGGSDEDEIDRQFLRRDGTGQRKKIRDSRSALATAAVPARHRRRHDDDRPLVGTEPRNDVAASNIPLVAAGDSEENNRKRVAGGPSEMTEAASKAAS